MSTYSYAICKKCKHILDLDKFIHYAGDDLQEWSHYSIAQKLGVFIEWAEKHAHHGIHLVDEHSELMDEDHHGWTYQDWRTKEERQRLVPERFRKCRP